MVAEGTVADIEASTASLTGQYISGRRQVPVPERRRLGNGHFLRVEGARANNLKSVAVDIPLGTLTVVTGVSGSGKSSLVLDVLYARLAQLIGGSRIPAGPHDRLAGARAHR